MKNNQDGFGAIEALLIAIVIGLIGGAGWYVYNSQKKTNQTLDKTAQSQSEPQKAAEYMEVKDWGVRMSSISNSKYKVTIPNKVYAGKNPEASLKQSSSGKLEQVYLMASGFTVTENTCTAENGQQLVATIFRDVVEQPFSAESGLAGKLPTKKVGDHYYFLEAGMGKNCVPTPTSEQNDLLDQIRKSFDTIKTI